MNENWGFHFSVLEMGKYLGQKEVSFPDGR